MQQQILQDLLLLMQEEVEVQLQEVVHLQEEQLVLVEQVVKEDQHQI